VLAMGHSQLSGKIVDSIANANSVRLFAREKYEGQYLQDSLEDVANKFRKKGWFEFKLSLVQGFSVTILIAVMIFGLIKLRSLGMVTVGDFALILSLALYVTEGIWYFTEQVHRLNDLIGRCNQSLNVIVKPHEIIDKPQANKIKITNGNIEFNDVTFNYKSNRNIFENKSVIIPGGQRLGLVGFSGSGKTTFVNLIVRLFDVSSGTIKIDNQNIIDVTQDSLREQIGFIPQDPALFHRSLMENIRYGNINASDNDVIQAAQKAHAHEFIMTTPDGYQSLVGERGIKLSGGQRQRISIARAILKNAPILILDEATSALDSVTEGYIQDSLQNLMQNKTVIVIAHRLSTLLAMDRILVFDQGKIVEDGNHLSLLKKEGMYAHLWNSQVGGFLLDENESALDL
jgi:ATP-binding cassette subfamily B protein